MAFLRARNVLEDDDDDYERALKLIGKQRSRGRVAALSLLTAGLLSLLGATYAMYARTPANTPAIRTGTSR